MHKKLAADLTSLAHSVLQLKNKEDVLELKQKAYEIYEKLSVLAYVDEYLSTTPNADVTKEELLAQIEKASEEHIEQVEEKSETVEEPIVEEVLVTEDTVELSVEEVEETIIEEVEEILEQPFDELEETLFSAPVEEVDDSIEEPTEEKKVISLEEELDDTISVDVAADLFDKPLVKKSLNDKLHENLQIGLNDRIAFVKNLFDGSQEDFNRVVSQINTLKTEKEAKKFIKKMVRPDYNWDEQEEYEERFMEIVERRFL